MGVIIRQSIKSSIVSYIGMVVGFVNIIFLYPKFLDQDHIGIIETIRAIVLLLSPFAISGLTQSVLKFFPKYAEDGKDSGFYISLGLLLFGWLTIFSILFVVFRDRIYNFFGYDSSYLEQFDWLILVSLFWYVVYYYLATICSSSLRITVPRLLDSVIVRLITMVLITLFGFSIIELNELIISVSLTYSLLSFILFGYVIKLKVIKWKLNTNIFKKNNIKEILKYAGYSLFAAASSIIIQKVDVIMIGMEENFDSVGIYVVAFFIGSAIEIPSRNIGDISFPILSRAFENNNLQEIESIYKKSSINQFVIGGLLFVLVWVCLDNLFALMPNGELYESGKNVVYIISFGKLIDMVMGVNNKIIHASNFYKYNFYTTVLLSVMVVLFNYIFIPKFSLIGAAIASMMALLIYNAICFLIVWWKMKIQPLSIKSLLILLIVIVSTALGFLLPSFECIILTLIYKTILIVLFYVFLIYFFKISDDANKILSDLFKKIFHLK